MLIDKHWDAHQHQRNDNDWQIVTRSKRRAQSQPPCSPDTQTQTSLCSQDPAHGCKRPRATFAVLSTLQDDDHEDPLPSPPPVEARGQKRGRSRGDLAATSTAPAADEPATALLSPPTEQGSQSSLTLPLAPQGPDLNTQIQLPDRAISSTIVQTSTQRRKRSKIADAATAAQTYQQQPQLQFRKRKSQTPPPQQVLRRSVRQRVASRAFDPSDPTATAGYVQRSQLGPEMQSGLPFDTG